MLYHIVVYYHITSYYITLHHNITSGPRARAGGLGDVLEVLGRARELRQRPAAEPERGGRVLLTEILLPRMAQDRIVCLTSIRE